MSCPYCSLIVYAALKRFASFQGLYSAMRLVAAQGVLVYIVTQEEVELHRPKISR